MRMGFWPAVRLIYNYDVSKQASEQKRKQTILSSL